MVTTHVCRPIIPFFQNYNHGPKQDLIPRNRVTLLRSRRSTTKPLRLKMSVFQICFLFGCPYLDHKVEGVTLYIVITPLSFKAFAGAAFVLAALDII